MEDIIEFSEVSVHLNSGRSNGDNQNNSMILSNSSKIQLHN